jgi:chorismate dehydratase
MDPLRIACVSYLNTAPLIQGLSKLASCTLIPTVPANIAGMITRAEVDLGLASVVDAARSNLTLIPAGMIGSDGPTLTVRVFSRIPFADLRELHADTDSHTSVVLCQLILKRLHHTTPRIIEWHAGQNAKWNVRSGNENGATASSSSSFHAPPSTFHFLESLLLIGDKVTTSAPPADDYPYQLDLGQAWKDLTGLPFVYALWMCRPDRESDPRIRLAAAVLDRQRRHNKARLDWIVSANAARHGWSEDAAANYLGSLLQFEVGPRQRQAVKAFLSMAVEDGLINPAPLRWIDQPAGAA